MKYSKQTISELPVHTSLLPPCIANFISGRKAVFTSGGPTVDIEDDVTIEDVLSRWNRAQPTGLKEPTFIGRKQWTVQGTKSKYNVTFMNEQYSCTCPGYGFRRKCKHVNEIKQRYE